jgi:parallel beta-helix repeat protein
MLNSLKANSKMVITLMKAAPTLFVVLCLCSTMFIIKNNKTIVGASPSMLIVGDEGFNSIQEAINNASPGDTIFVRKGTYYENIVVNKSITLAGEDKENTIIDGGGKESVVSVKASYVNISGFTIKNSASLTGCGISIERYRTIINNNKITNNGIGIQVIFPGENQIYENVISTNYCGIELTYVRGTTIYKNVITHNTYGVNIIYYSINNIVYENSFSSNNYGIYISLNSNNNIFYHNNLINNTYNVYAEQTTNIWSYNNEGNYWSDYKGQDINGDGIGDTPHNITGKNKDNYPLMGKFYALAVSLEGYIYNKVAIISNSTILDFTFKNVVESKSRVMRFNASCITGSSGFSRLAIPRSLMENIHMVLVNEKEVNATLLNTTSEENIFVYLTYSGNCTITIVYSELLDLYYQLLANHLELLNKYNDLLNEYGNLNETHYRLLEKYINLEEKMLALNLSNSGLLEQLQVLNETLYNLLEDYNKLQNEFNYANLSYQTQAQSLKDLMYIFAAMTAVFIVATIYLSKKAHEKSGTEFIKS